MYVDKLYSDYISCLREKYSSQRKGIPDDKIWAIGVFQKENKRIMWRI